MPLHSFRARSALWSLPLLWLAAACAPVQGGRSLASPVVTRPAAVDTLLVGDQVLAEAPVEPLVAPVLVDETDRIAVEARRLFGDDTIPLTVPPPVADTLVYDGDLPRLELDAYAEHARVSHYVGLFTGTAKRRTEERLSRGTRYDALIRAKLRAGGIPEDFRYLALIESGYEPDAVSTASAVGMWQFMSATARGVGLRVDWWVDERRDVVKSTDAAVTFLNQLQAQFGSLYLAAAAYNGGPGRVQRGLTRHARDVARAEPDDRFFTLAQKNALATETKNYVPQLIAAALIGRDPSAFGMVIDTQPAFEYDEVDVPAATALAGVGAACAVTASEIVALNGQLLRGMTPPDRETTTVRVPRGCAPGFEERLALVDDTLRAGLLEREVEAGETLAGVAKASGLTTTVLRQLNPGLTMDAQGRIRRGAPLRLPTPAARAAWRKVADPTSAASSSASYVVKRGDTLSGIAKQHGTTVARLKSLNGLKNSRIAAGKRLRVR
jgi:membrane-bound lytic murein transglycosylase D